MGKKPVTKSAKKAHKTPSESATGEPKEECSTEDIETSQPRKSKSAAKKARRRKKRAENDLQNLSSEDIVTDSVRPKKRGRFRTRKGEKVKVPGKFISGKAVVNIWDEEEGMEEEGETKECGTKEGGTKEGDTKTQKRKQPGKKHNYLSVGKMCP